MKIEENKKPTKEPRSYPPFWERAVPILVTLIGLFAVGLLIVAVLVVFGIFPGSG